MRIKFLKNDQKEKKKKREKEKREIIDDRAHQ